MHLELITHYSFVVVFQVQLICHIVLVSGIHHNLQKEKKNLNHGIVLCWKFFSFLCCCLVTKSHPTLCDPMDCSPSGYMGFPCPWDCPGKNAGVSGHFLLQRDLPSPGIEPASPALAGGFFTAERPGKPSLM